MKFEISDTKVANFLLGHPRFLCNLNSFGLVLNFRNCNFIFIIYRVQHYWMFSAQLLIFHSCLPCFRTLLRGRNKECCFLGNSNVWKLYKCDCMWKTIYGLMECHFSSWIFQKVMIFGFSDCLSPCAMPITMVA